MSAIRDHGEPAYRNVICCLLALEIAEYDAKPVFDQIRSTQDFQKLLSAVTAHTSADDLVSIVREDGALLSFLADPEDCFTAALTIREATSTQDCYRDLTLRIGITLGTVQIAEDEFGHPYVSGEGRHDVDRVMRHGPPRQISVARPFFELLSRAAPELSGLLEYQGVFSDTVGPPLCLYRLSPPHTSGSEGPDPPRPTPISDAVDASGWSTLALQAVRAQTLANRRKWLRRAWLRYVFFPLLVGALLLTAPSRFPGVVPGLLPEGQLAMDAREQAAPAPAVSSSASVRAEQITRPPDAMPRAELADAPAMPRPVTLSDDARSKAVSRERHRDKRPPVASKHVAVAEKRVTQKSKVTAEDATNTPSPQVPRAATLVLAIKPWGEVYIDGQKVGITPPLKRFEVAPGRRQITITNSSLPSYRREVTLDPEEQMTVAHDFDCISDREKPCRGEFGKGLELPSRFRLATTEAGRS